MEYLVFWVTRDGVKPINRKIKVINNVNPPTYQRQVQKFIGVVNYYRYMWPRRSHMLAPLTKLTSIKKKFKWENVEQDSFNKIKQIVARETLLTYPYFNKVFKTRTNAGIFQLGAFISHKGKQIAFYSRKLTDAQQRYTVTQKELIRIVETLKTFRTILLGKKLRIYNDHKTLHVRILIMKEY